jgi:hypothetical protein
MKIRDRGKMKWLGALFAPEHRSMLRELERDEMRQARPMLDEYQFEEFDQRICYAMEFTQELKLTIWRDGFTYEEKGYAHYSDPLRKELRLKDKNDMVVRIKYEDIVAVEVVE